MLQPGEVWLTGAGPGDPGLLTLHALNAISQADIILYDALVNDAVLKLARPGVVLESAGKRGGRPSPNQRDITERLIELARQGQRVLRLKGGDPFVFGRGGEEAMGLAAAGISFRIIPGLTAGLAGLAYANIPATTRDTNHGVILVTGQYAAGNERAMEWSALAQSRPADHHLHGHDPSSRDRQRADDGRPVPRNPGGCRLRGDHAAPENTGHDARQRRPATSAAQGLGSPSIVAIGEMVKLRAALTPFAIALGP